MNAKSILKTTSGLTLGLITCAILAGCASSGNSPEHDSTAARVDAALKNAASAQDERIPSLSAAEKIYTKNPEDPIAATKYAAALREANYANRASVVLAPFADNAKSPQGVKTEFAAIQLALGNNESAERYAQKAVLQNPQDGKAYHYLGIALDAQGKHPEAERAFRKGLDLWTGDPTSIMNNLALNLSAQGFLDEAAEILEKAKAVSPNRVEIERNLRIVTALRQSGQPSTPKPKKKPEPPSAMDSVEPASDESADEPPAPAAKAPVKAVTPVPAH